MGSFPNHSLQYAEVAELVDALGSGSSGGSPVEVRVFSSAPAEIRACSHMAVGFFFSALLFTSTLIIVPESVYP